MLTVKFSRDASWPRSSQKRLRKVLWLTGIAWWSTKADTTRELRALETGMDRTTTEFSRSTISIGVRLDLPVEIVILIATVSFWRTLQTIENSLINSELLDDDITDDIVCAKKIYRRQGYAAWYGWKNNCKGKVLPSVDDCFWLIQTQVYSSQLSVHIHSTYQEVFI